MQSIIPKAADFINDICRDRAAPEGAFRLDKKTARFSAHRFCSNIFYSFSSLRSPGFIQLSLQSRRYTAKVIAAGSMKCTSATCKNTVIKG